MLFAAINFLADPAGIYRTDLAGPIQFANTLVKAEHGLWWPENSNDDRAFKKELSKHSSDSECVVIGSSHVMQAGSARKTKALTNLCSSIINLGVTGASIEDHFTLAFLSLKNGTPKKIVFGVAPWTLAFGKTQGWFYYAENYQEATQEIHGKPSTSTKREDSALQSKLRNLFSLEYTIRSVRKMVQNLSPGSNHSDITAAPKLDETIGGTHPAILRDGSLLYSAEYIAKAKADTIPLGGTLYETDGNLNEANAIKSYKSLLTWVKNKGVEPILLMTPYHQNVWKAPASLNARALVATEPIVRAMGKELGIRVIGTYNPNAAGCLESEFFDFMHPKSDCLVRLAEDQDR